MSFSKNLSLLLISMMILSFTSLTTDLDNISTNGINPVNYADRKIAIESSTDVDILLLMDHDFGSAYLHIISNFEKFGWNVTIAGTNQTMISCLLGGGWTPLVPDILFHEISDITVFDAISIMPGSSHDILLTNETDLGLIRTAVEENLVVSAWCRAVRILAAADVLDGKNITGHSDYEAEYVAAGATFNDLALPIIDENIVTCGRSQNVRFEMYQAIATALGVYDGSPPGIDTISCNPSVMTSDSSSTLSVTFDDEMWVADVEVDIFLLNDAGTRVHENATLNLNLQLSESEIYTTEIAGLEDGTYTLDLMVSDSFGNEITYSDVVTLAVGAISLPLDVVLIGCAIGGTIAIITVILVKSRGS